MSNSGTQVAFRLGEWLVDPELCELRRNDAEIVPIQPRVMDVLLCLAEAEGRVVSRQKLVENVWQGRPTSDEPINRCIAELRAALGDDRSNPTYIRTVPKRGYQLLVPATPVTHRWAGDEAEPGRAWDWVLFLGTALVLATAWYFTQQASPREARILVTPIVVLSDDGEYALFADALTEEIIHSLTLRTDLAVLSRTTAFNLRDARLPADELAARVEAQYLVEGSLREVNGRLRITVQLIDTASDAHLFSRAYEQPRELASRLPERISQAVASQVGESLATYRSEQQTADLSFESFREFVEAKHLLRSPEVFRLDDVIARFEQVVEQNPDFADAHAYLAATLLQKYRWESVDPALLDRVDRLLETTLALDEANALAIHLRGLRSADLVEREKFLRRALALEPANVELQRGLAAFLEQAGFLVEARDILARLIRRDPLNSGVIHGFARLNCSMGRFAECARGMKQGAGMKWPGRPLEALHLHLAMKDRESAIAVLQDYLKNSRSIPADDIALIVSAYFDPLLRDQARERINEIESALPGEYKFWPSLFWALVGENERSVQAITRHEKHGWEDRMLLHYWGHAYAGVRKSPHFAELAAYYGFPELWAASGPAYYCRTIDLVAREIRCR